MNAIKFANLLKINFKITGLYEDKNYIYFSWRCK